MHRRFLSTLAFVVVAALATGCETATPRLHEIEHKGHGQLYRCGTQKVLVLSGSGFEMGLQHGELLAPAVRTVVRETLVWTAKQGLSREHLAEIYGQLEPHIPQRYKDEMRGLAEGSGAPLRAIQLLHAMPSEFHCSGAAVAHSMTVDGKLYHSRSLDYSLDIGVEDRIQNHALLIVRRPSGGIPNAVPAWAGFLGAVTGMNSAGISVGEKGSESNDESYAGMPMIFTVREVLRRTRTLDEAVAVFQKGPRTCGFNFIVGSGSERKAVAIEVTRNHFFLSGFGDPVENVPPHQTMPDTVRRTNHFVGRNTAKTQPRRDTHYHPKHHREGTWLRYQRISEFLAANRGRLDAKKMVELLRQYPPGHPCLHQVVMCPEDLVIWVSQAVDDRNSSTPGAQNQTFTGYRLAPSGRIEFVGDLGSK